jgi:N-acetylneuraminic acid mutarotase
MCLSTVERYNLMTGTWEEVKSLNQPRMEIGLISVNQHLYVIGGRNQ